MGEEADERPQDRKEFGVRDPTKASVIVEERERDWLGGL